MKYLRKFQTNADYQAFKNSSDYVTPVVSIITDNDTVVFEPLVGSAALFTFTVNGNEYQAEEGMTFYDWALSEYFDISCRLTINVSSNLRDEIIENNISSNVSACIFWGAGVPINPSINTDTIIQPISYMIDSSMFQ